MKIMRCPNCQGIVVINTMDKYMQKVVKCCHCGFSDYAYVFNLSPKRHSNKTPREMSVGDVIETVSQQLNDVDHDLSSVNVNQFIYDLNSRCKEFSPFVICKLINALLEHSEYNDESLVNEILFVKYEADSISLDDIYKKLKDLQATSLSKIWLEDSSSDETQDTNIQILKNELQSRLHEIDTWVKEYDLLLEKYQKVKEENETLKYLFKQNIK